MPDSNAYESPIAPKPNGKLYAQRSGRKWALIGFLVGALIPILWGVHLLRAEAILNASIPEVERIACGNGSLGIMFLMVVAAPLLGTIGAATGFGLSRVL